MLEKRTVCFRRCDSPVLEAALGMVSLVSISTHAPDRSIAAALRDLHHGLRRWPVWWLLASMDIKQRYRRSRIGQLWLTISMGVTIGALGLVYPFIFHIPVGDYLPHIAVSFVCWTLIAGLLTDGSTAFLSAASFLKQSSDPRSIYVYRVLARNALMLLHNALIIAVVFIGFGVPLTGLALLSLPGLALLFIAGGWAALLLGALCTRFRDLPQIVASFIQVAFFVTPVMWRPQMLPADMQWLVAFNPLAAFLAVIGKPLLGERPAPEAWLLAALVAFGGYLVVVPFFARFRARIVYWL